jgi:hypothetical protein
MTAAPLFCTPQQTKYVDPLFLRCVGYETINEVLADSHQVLNDQHYIICKRIIVEAVSKYIDKHSTVSSSVHQQSTIVSTIMSLAPIKDANPHVCIDIVLDIIKSVVCHDLRDFEDQLVDICNEVLTNPAPFSWSRERSSSSEVGAENMSTKRTISILKEIILSSKSIGLFIADILTLSLEMERMGLFMIILCSTSSVEQCTEDIRIWLSLAYRNMPSKLYLYLSVLVRLSVCTAFLKDLFDLDTITTKLGKILADVHTRTGGTISMDRR